MGSADKVEQYSEVQCIFLSLTGLGSLMTQVKDTVEESIYKLNKSRNTSSFISGNRKNQDQPCLTLRDVESLFRVAPVATAEDQTPSGSMRDLPPSVAAAIAAEKRLMDAQK